jgi:tetratricopeptide (TPR) repeat protein
MRRSLIALVALLCAPLLARAAAPDYEALNKLVDDWQVHEARAELEPLLKASPDDPGLKAILARVQFNEGAYGDSLKTLDELRTALGGKLPNGVEQFRQDVQRTYDALKDFDEYVTPDKRFLIRTQGRDKVLLPYLEEVLRKQDEVLQQDFNYKPEGQVVVEIYPDISYLAKVSPLTEEEIETSGTIALCKYNRLMFTSPRGLVRGYAWRDTVSHEFVHYYVTHKSHDTVPIWLHEGIAKFQETRWRTAPGLALDPPSEDLLARSVQADKLVTFQQMHPSMAKLPSQEAAALAFAEVHTVIQYLHKKKGYPGINALIEHLRDGDDMNVALQKTYGFDLDGLWASWHKQLGTLALKTYPGLVRTSLKFKRPGEQPKGEDQDSPDIETIGEKKVKDLTHLGELLRARGRLGAAMKEYDKAQALGGDGNPMLQNAIATSLVALKRFAEVPDRLNRVKSYYPDYLTTWLNLGEAYLALGKRDDALSAFEQALGINPYHPRVFEALAQLYDQAGRTDDAARARASLEIVR